MNTMLNSVPVRTVVLLIFAFLVFLQFRSHALSRHHSPKAAGIRAEAGAPLAQIPSEGTTSDPQQALSIPLREARERFHTTLTQRSHDGEPAQQPPPNLLKLVKYPASIGPCAAYITPNAEDHQKHPAIVWAFGGFSNGIGAAAWARLGPENDQSASAFREAGIVEMYPSFRGGNDNPGVHEAFLGEVDDLLSAVHYLSQMPGVDPKRIYLGGHSTGGTLALLGAESSDRFRAVFAFGPVASVAGYGQDVLPYDTTHQAETLVRSPVFWMDDVKDPTFVLFGTEQPTNIDSIQRMIQICKNQRIHFLPVRGATHFSILAPITKLLAQKILADSGPTCSISITEDELVKAFHASTTATQP
jgi:acetyl esterase/lipase